MNSGQATFETVKTFSNGGNLFVHPAIDQSAADFKDIYESCIFFAEQGNSVWMTPKLHPKSTGYKEISASLLGTLYEGKSPDFKVGDRWYEYEGFTKDADNALRNMLNRGQKQAECLVIEDEGSTLNHIRKVVAFRVRQGQRLKEVWVHRTDGGLDRTF